MEHRSGLVVSAVVTHADGYDERAAALAMLDTLPGKHPRTVAADKAHDTRDFAQACRQLCVTPHVASHTMRWGGSAIDGRTTRHTGYAISQTSRKRIEEHFGWGKTVGRIRQTVYRGIERVDQQFKLTMTASNIVRIARMFSAMGAGSGKPVGATDGLGEHLLGLRSSFKCQPNEPPAVGVDRKVAPSVENA